jgi:hypothetical protein
VPPVAAVADSATATELTIRWVAGASANNDPVPAQDLSPVNQFELMSRRSVSTNFVRERAPELARERLVIVAIDASGREVAWQQVLDPRIVRAELPGPTGELRGQTLYRPVADLVVAFPDSLSVAALRVYEVRWNGSEFVLDPLGEVAAGAR